MGKRNQKGGGGSVKAKNKLTNKQNRGNKKNQISHKKLKKNFKLSQKVLLLCLSAILRSLKFFERKKLILMTIFLKGKQS